MGYTKHFSVGLYKTYWFFLVLVVPVGAVGGLRAVSGVEGLARAPCALAALQCWGVVGGSCMGYGSFLACGWLFPGCGEGGLWAVSKVECLARGVSPSDVYPAGKLPWHFACGFDFIHSLWLPFVAAFAVLKGLIDHSLREKRSVNLFTDIYNLCIMFSNTFLSWVLFLNDCLQRRSFQIIANISSHDNTFGSFWGFF